jgi:hypothetical protein
VKPPVTSAAETASVPQRNALGYASIGLLVSLVAFQMAATTFWSYSERIASAAGLPSNAIALAVSLGNLGGVPASLLGAAVGERFGFLPLLLLATIAAVGGELVMAGAGTSGLYLAGQLIFNFGWILGVTYYLALLARDSSNSKIMRAAPIALVVAGILGHFSVATLEIAGTTQGLLVLDATLALVALVPAILRRHNVTVAHEGE